MYVYIQVMLMVREASFVLVYFWDNFSPEKLPCKHFKALTPHQQQSNPLLGGETSRMDGSFHSLSISFH